MFLAIWRIPNFWWPFHEFPGDRKYNQFLRDYGHVHKYIRTVTKIKRSGSCACPKRPKPIRVIRHTLSLSQKFKSLAINPFSPPPHKIPHLCLHVCVVRACAFARVLDFVHACVYLCVCVRVCVHACSACMCVYICARVGARACTCVCVCVHACGRACLWL